MQLGVSLDGGEPDAGAARFGGEEQIENSAPDALRDSRPLISHFDRDRTVFRNAAAGNTHAIT
ncbi:MAG: hypothetical protein B6D36_07065 [Planctomycetes bacterium UTPLA1]|nr:MAG: hypothetical protein B6D36_07065 [Planctomycetes bacterium UTPLA1]